MLRDHLARRRVKKIFGKLVKPDAVQEVLGDPPQDGPLTATDIELVLVLVRFESPKQFSKLIERVLEICSRHEALIDGLSGSLVVAAFGVQPHAAKRPGAARKLAAALIKELGPDVKIVCAAGTGYCGHLGFGDSVRFSFVLQGFDALLALLSKTEFGTAQEIKL